MSEEKKILIVDDELSIRELLSRQLGAEGFEVFVAEDASHAERIIKESNPDVVLLDIAMPGESGTEFLERMTLTRRKLPFIMMTGAGDVQQGVECLKTGAYGYVFKPLNIEEIRVNIANALNRAAIERQNEEYRKHLERMVGEQTRKVRDLLKVTESSFDDMIRVLGRAFDRRHGFSEGHCPRVANTSILIGHALEIPEPDLKDIKWGAYLHDIGMIVIPESILLKREELTREEWHVIMQHPEIGRELIQDVELLSTAAELVHAHQERYDGKGYPKHLNGPQIPLGARIISVADALDVMLSERPSRKRLQYEEAKRDIVACSGTQFDPNVVNVFMEQSDTIVSTVYPDVERPGRK